MPTPAAGFFGKLPSAGDFVQRRLPAGFVDVWDPHFEGAVAESRGALNGAWFEAYHASPLWRFLLAPRVCGESAWVGVMGPGTDRVGRCFPMVIAAPLAADPETCRRVLRDAGGWFDAAEHVHSEAQADASISVDAFDEHVASLGGPFDVAPPAAAELLTGVDWSAAAHWRLPLSPKASAGSFLSDLWTHLATASGSWCLWWTAGAERMPASVLITNGLPQPSAYAGFLDAGHGVAPWQSLGVFESAATRDHATPVVAGIAATVVSMEPTPLPTWLPDDLELFSDLGTVVPEPAMATSVASVASAASEAVSMPDPAAGIAVLRRPDSSLTLVAAEVGPREPRQQAVAAVRGIVQALAGAELTAGMQTLRTQIMALNPQLRLAGEDLIDPVVEDCAVIAAHVAAGQVDLLRIGTAAAWHWRAGRLQPLFVNSDAPPVADAGQAGDFDDLLFGRVSLTAPGLGATALPTCGEVCCVVAAGDRLLLVATPSLVQLSPDVLARSLALPSCDEASLRIASAAGLGADPAQWPLAIIEIDA